MTSNSKSGHHLVTPSLFKQCARQLEPRGSNNDNNNAGERFLIIIMPTVPPGRVTAEQSDPPPTSNDDDSDILDDSRSDRFPNIDYTHNHDMTISSSMILDEDDSHKKNKKNLPPRAKRRRTAASSVSDCCSVQGQQTQVVATPQNTPVVPSLRNFEMELRIMNVLDSALNLLEETPSSSSYYSY